MAGQAGFRRVCRDPKDTLKFIIAALLHDIGHYPLAHQVEEFSEHDFTPIDWAKVKDLVSGHHRYGETILDTKLHESLKRLFDFTDEDVKEVKELAFGESPDLRDPLHLLRSMLNGPIDLDKLDYVERDAHHCGVPYGNYLDIERVLETMRIIPDKNGQPPIMAFLTRGVGCIEQIVTARHQMYGNVYWHRAVRSATTMFKHAFHLFQNKIGEKEKLQKIFYTSGSDDGVLMSMSEMADKMPDSMETRALKELIRAISGKERVLYKEIIQKPHTVKHRQEYGEFHPAQRVKAEKIYHFLKSLNMLDDAADDVGAHAILIDAREDNSPDFHLVKVVDDSGNVAEMGTLVPSTRSSQEDFKTQACKIRVFIRMQSLSEIYRGKEGRSAVAKAIENGIKQKLL